MAATVLRPARCPKRAGMPTTMTLRLHKDFFNFPSGCLKKSHPIADYAPRPADFLGSQRLNCLAYLIENSKKELSSFSKITALHLATRQGHLDCVKYLIKKYGEGFSIEDRKTAYQMAVNKKHSACAAYLDAHLKSSAPISPNANSITFAFDEQMNLGEKRKQEEEGANSKSSEKRKGNK